MWSARTAGRKQKREEKRRNEETGPNRERKEKRP